MQTDRNDFLSSWPPNGRSEYDAIELLIALSGPVLFLSVPLLAHKGVESHQSPDSLDEIVDDPGPPQPGEQGHAVWPQPLDSEVDCLSKVDRRHGRYQKRLDRVAESGEAWHVAERDGVERRPGQEVAASRERNKGRQADGEQDRVGSRRRPVLPDDDVGEAQRLKAVIAHVDDSLPDVVERRERRLERNPIARAVGADDQLREADVFHLGRLCCAAGNETVDFQEQGQQVLVVCIHVVDDALSAVGHVG
ncbi:hypothetical protein T310_6690 [Rasamsonia emersonii CBS 393.64]|uniref:Uncharacterized protein n=1 Tax=Rasamsonia emersonii (strain ATCC 16479 / CBS 393.64 / IMI 116815) TaxID=1408163 RepID=A0A0F4YNW4_RASE3|nr:hypothetical protein T310_6690 [Rasamsonia emersonii CBS 393.64]KKA19323.1 hypothetical protein T310_6690 [Rasamsonia emersonii CBS 393.64]